MQQHRVAALLDEIAARRRRLYALKAELAEIRHELAEVTDAATTLRARVA